MALKHWYFGHTKTAEAACDPNVKISVTEIISWMGLNAGNALYLGRDEEFSVPEATTVFYLD
jgi:hypothetical protein